MKAYVTDVAAAAGCDRLRSRRNSTDTICLIQRAVWFGVSYGDDRSLRQRLRKRSTF